jgi:hypothetical protein
MKRILGAFAFMGMAVFSAVAQDTAQLDNKLMDELKARTEELARSAATMREGAVMAQPVLGAPFAATEVNETNQTLADGTRIHKENSTQVYRDGAGRTRRDAGNTSIIMDPVAKVRYSINHEHKTATAMPMNLVKKVVSGPVNVTTSATVAWTVTYNSENGKAAAFLAPPNGEEQSLRLKVGEVRGNNEELGTQTMEGVVAQGTRTTRTIPVGDIGNDRPINVTSERWYSPQLSTIMMTKQNDPRTGENTFRLSNVKLGEPDPTLFQIPAGYQLTERK